MAAKKTVKTKKKTAKKASKKAAAKTTKKVAAKAVKKASTKTTKKTTKKTVKKALPKAAAKKAKKTVKKARKKKIKSPLTKPQLKQFRKMLLEKRRSLVGDMNGMEAGALGRGRDGTGSGELSTIPDHPANIASDNYEQEFMLGLLESERVLLDQIDEALQRIADKMYGICLGTAEPIGLARLKARPWSKYCIDYARQIEQGKIGPGEGVLEAGAGPAQDED